MATLQLLSIVAVVAFCAFFAALWVHKNAHRRREERLQARMDYWGSYIVRCRHFQTHGCSLEFPCNMCEHYNENTDHTATSAKEKTNG